MKTERRTSPIMRPESAEKFRAGIFLCLKRYLAWRGRRLTIKAAKLLGKLQIGGSKHGRILFQEKGC